MNKKLLSILLILALLIGGGEAVWAQGGAGWFDFNNDIRLHGDVWAMQDVRVDDDITVTDDAIFVDIFASPQTTTTVTSGGSLAPLGYYQRISAAGAVGLSTITGCTSNGGRIVQLVNVGSNTITFTDTGTLKLAGNAALGQYDGLTLLCDGAGNWLQVSKADN